MSPVKRVTPDVGFPESQGGTLAYGEAWPLSEDYYLCVYDAAAEVPGLGATGNHGIYLVDSFGNKELIYRDPAIGCHSPMPLAPRPKPPVSHEPAKRFTAGQDSRSHCRRPQRHTVASGRGRRARRSPALRVLQVLPLSVGSTATAHNTGLQIPRSSSINIARAVLGTVPVEEDGSAYFTVPAGKEVFFQALDSERPGGHLDAVRYAIPARRSSRLPGLPRTAPRHAADARTNTRSQCAARRRGCSQTWTASNPFSYPRLVQPVLDKNCVACHQKNVGKAPPLDARIVSRPSSGFMDRPTQYYASYLSLVPKFGFYDYGDDLKTIPGKFGAHAAPLWQMLSKGHHGVKLNADEMHRIALWLDCLSSFYGVYEKEGGEAQLRGEIALPTLQ